MSRARRTGNEKKNAAGRPLSGGRRYVTGRHVLEELLEHAPERIEKALIVESATAHGKGDGARRRDLIKKLQDLRKPIQFFSPSELDSMVGTTSHQGFAAVVRERHFQDLTEFIDEQSDKKNSIVLLLDGITDPHNLGTVLRAAECFGVDAVIWSKNRGVDLTPVVSKASVGASELVPIIRVSNLADAARKLKAADYWVASAVIHENARSLNDFDAPDRVALIVGSEGEGIGRLIVEASDYMVYIPLEGAIQSLNVSQAATVFLYELRRQQKQCRP